MGANQKSRFMILTGVLCVPSAATASPPYPGYLQEIFAMECAPTCKVCHLTDPGTERTAVQPFVVPAMYASLGLAGKLGRDELEARLRARQMFDDDGDAATPTVAVDVDMDGVSDIDELLASTDPNVPGDLSLCGPKYGCGASIAPRPSRRSFDSPFGALGIVTVAAVIAVIRRRHPRRR